MKRIIIKNLSIFLSALMLFNMPAQLFAQNINYKPALSFEYDYFTLGKTDEEEFTNKLIQDIEDNFYDDILALQNPPDYYYPNYNNNNLSPEKAYNEFLYYSQYPQESPYWKWTAFEPGQGATENDVLLILKKHQELSKEILHLLKQSTRYKRDNATKWTLIVFGGVILAAESYVLWATIPAISAELAAYGIPAKGAKIATTIGAFAYDIWSNDYVAYRLRNLDGIKVQVDDADIYRSTTIKSMKKRNMLKSQIESAQIQICSEAEENYRSMKTAYVATNGKAPVVEEMKKWEPIVKFCNGNKRIIKDKQFRQDLGQYLIMAYSKLDNPDGHIEYAREEMVGIYHALLFIKAELQDENDPLRFDRAMLDIITTYKLAYITFTDGRIIKIFSKPEITTHTDRLKTKGLNDEDLNIEVDYQTSLEEKLEFNSSPNILSYPSLMSRSQINYIVQKMDIYNQKEQKRIDEEWERSWNQYMKEHPYPIQK